MENDCVWIQFECFVFDFSKIREGFGVIGDDCWYGKIMGLELILKYCDVFLKLVNIFLFCYRVWVLMMFVIEMEVICFEVVCFMNLMVQGFCLIVEGDFCMVYVRIQVEQDVYDDFCFCCVLI